jgi:hypothetical protein
VKLLTSDDPQFDYALLSQEIPERLREMIQDPPTSLVCQALCRQPIIGIPEDAYREVMRRLDRYLKRCITENLISESSYMALVIDQVKSDRAEGQRQEAAPLERIVDEITIYQDRLTEERKKWTTQRDSLNLTRDNAFIILSSRMMTEEERLKAEWQSEPMKIRYNRPSRELEDSRARVNELLKAHDFEGAQEQAKLVAKLQRKEEKVAAERMERDYKIAWGKLYSHYTKETEALQAFWARQLRINRSAESRLVRGIQMRLKYLKKLRDRELSKQKGGKKAAGRGMPQAKSQVVSAKPPVVAHERLKLPDLERLPDS